MHDKRRHARLQARQGDVVHPLFTCLDLSESGMKFASASEVKRGSIITVELNALAKPVKIMCKVVWCREATSTFGDGFHFGVMYTNFSFQNQLRFRELVEDKTNN